MSVTAQRTSWMSRSSSRSLHGASIAGSCFLPGRCSLCLSRIIGLRTKSIRSYPNKIRYRPANNLIFARLNRCVIDAPTPSLFPTRFQKQELFFEFLGRCWELPMWSGPHYSLRTAQSADGPFFIPIKYSRRFPRIPSCCTEAAVRFR